MAKQFNQTEMIAAFDRIGEAAAHNRHNLELAVYGGSALMLASSFRFASEDVDIAELSHPWPEWLRKVVSEIAADNGWSEDWINDAVTFHPSEHSDKNDDQVLVGTFPRSSEDGSLKVFVPSAEYMLALKLKASRMNDPVKGTQEAGDIVNLLKVLELETPESAIKILARFFPKTAEDPSKQIFLLKQIWNMETVDAPSYPRRSR